MIAWISTKKRMPPVKQPVLFAARGLVKYGYCENEIDWSSGYQYLVYTWYELTGNGERTYPESSVIHWTPLPEPPEQAAEETETV